MYFFTLFHHLGILELARLVDIQFAPIEYKEYDQIFPLVEVEPVCF